MAALVAITAARLGSNVRRAFLDSMRFTIVLDDDLVVPAIAVAFLVRHGLDHGFGDFESSVLAAAWIAPL